MSVAFVLSGGGSLGAVQVGMLQALADHDIEPDVLIGTSVGAINAAWAAGHPGAGGARRLATVWRSLRRGDVFPFRPLVGLAGLLGRSDHLVAPGPLRALVADCLTFERIEDAPIPVSFVATDVVSGTEVVLREGDAADAIMASAAIPGVFPPVLIDGRALMDGGVANNFPIAHAVERGATTVYVLPSGTSCALASRPRSALALALQALNQLVQQHLAAEIARFTARVDVHVLPPVCPLSISPLDFRHTDDLITGSHALSAEWLATRRDVADPAEALRPHDHTHRSPEKVGLP